MTERQAGFFGVAVASSVVLLLSGCIIVAKGAADHIVNEIGAGLYLIGIAVLALVILTIWGQRNWPKP